MVKISVFFQVVLLFQKITAASLVPIKHDFGGGAIQLYLSLVFHFEKTQGIHSFVITFCHLYSLYPFVYSLSLPFSA